MRQVAAGARQTDVARAQGLLPALLGRWQLQALAEATPSSAARAEFKRIEQERDMLKKSHGYPCATTSFMSRYQFIKQVMTSEPL